jgi:hypothetical protein
LGAFYTLNACLRCCSPEVNFDEIDFCRHLIALSVSAPPPPLQRTRSSESKRMAGRVKYARRASGRVSSYALDSEADSTDADEAVQAKKRRSTANKGEQGRAGELDKLLLTLTSRTAFAGRGKGKRTRAEEDEDESTAGEASDESDSPKKKKKPRKKRAKKSNDDKKKKKKKRGKQGKLETIQMLPLEMLSEVSRRRPPPS